MKKFFLLAAAALVAFASCSKNDAESVNKDKAIGFNTYTGRTVTKASSQYFVDKQKTALVLGTQFGVFAYNSGSAEWAGGTDNIFMKNVAVKYKTEGATTPTNYEYSPLRYWPNDEANNKLSFFAYYPYGDTTGITVPDKGFDKFTFTVKNKPASMIDFLLSEVEKDQVYSTNNGVVPMKFHHTLAMVQFKIKTTADVVADANTKIELVSATLKNINSKGEITPKVTWGTDVKWANQGTPVNFNVYPAGALELTASEVTLPSGTAANDAFLMIPQELAESTVVNDVSQNDGAVLEVVYKVTTTDPETQATSVITNTKTLDLCTATVPGNNNDPTAVTEWKMNMSIIYTLVVDLKPIRFTAAVTVWDGDQTATININ